MTDLLAYNKRIVVKISEHPDGYIILQDFQGEKYEVYPENAYLEPLRKVTASELALFLTRFARKEFPHQRMGQAFLNTFYAEYICPGLFYETNIGLTITILNKHFQEG